MEVRISEWWAFVTLQSSLQHPMQFCAISLGKSIIFSTEEAKGKSSSSSPSTPQKARGLMWLKFWKFDISSQDPESWASGTNMKGWFEKHSYLLGAYCPCLCLPWFLNLFNPGLSASSVSSQFPSNNFPFHLGQSQSDSVTWNQKSSLIWGSGQDSEL